MAALIAWLPIVRVDELVKDLRPPKAAALRAVLDKFINTNRNAVQAIKATFWAFVKKTQPPSRILIKRRCPHIILDHPPDMIDQGDEFRRALDLEVAWPRQRDLDLLLQPAGPARKHQHAVGQEHRL